MNKFQEHINNTAKAVVSNMLVQDAREWPPSCMILAYQPMRPTQQMDDAECSDHKPSPKIDHK